MKIAIVGGGAAGVAAAWALSSRHDITLYEKDRRMGGHINTLKTDFHGEEMTVDLGFVVFNHETYPILSALFDLLKVETKPGRMTLSLCGGKALAFATNVKQTVKSNKLRAIDPRFLLLGLNIARFNRRANRDLKRAGDLSGSIADYLKRNGFSEKFFDGYLGPLAAAIWISTPAQIRTMPAYSFLRFFDHHRLLEFNGHRWRTVCGGASNYIKKLIAQFPDSVRTGCAAMRVERGENGVTVTDSKGGTDAYDHVVMACHPDEALAAMPDATVSERQILGSFTSMKNHAVCHADPRLMPDRREMWASWNCLYGPNWDDRQDTMSVTYFLNLIHQIDQSKPLFVTVNPHFEPRKTLTLMHLEFGHVQYDDTAIAAQKRFYEIQGINRTWYAGAYRGYGFHEDAVGSGLDVARAIGCDALPLPEWKQPDW